MLRYRLLRSNIKNVLTIKRKRDKKIVLILAIFSIFILYHSTSENSSSNKNKTRYEKYIVFEEGYNGFADRLKGIISTFAIAKLSERNLLININKPCNLTYFLLPNKIDWSRSVEDLILKNKLPGNYSRVEIEYFAKPDGLFKEYKIEDIEYFIFNYSEIDVIYFRTYNVQWLWGTQVSSKSENAFFSPRISQKIKDLGLSQLDFHMYRKFKDWFDQLFKLTPKLQHEYERYNKLMRPNGAKTKVICAQIRTHDIQSKKNASVADQFWSYIKNKLIPKIDQAVYNHRIFVTSDFHEIESLTSLYFGKQNVVYTESDNRKESHFLKLSNCESDYKFVLDFFLMSNCDVGLFGHGEFGFWALLNRAWPQNLNTMVKLPDTMPADFYVEKLGNEP
jgi:hypothetical protein